VDDQLELFFLRLLRGSGGEGLAGMRWRNPSPENSRIELVRPLLDVSKSELHEFAVQRKISFREDATNASPDIQRNRIRHELLPLLRRCYQSALDRTLLRVMEIAGADAEFAGMAAAEWLKKEKRPPFGKLPVAVQRRAIQLQLRQHNVAADFDLIERLRSTPGCPVTIAPGRAVVAGSDGQLRLRKAEVPAPESESLKLDLENRAGEITFGHLRIRWSIHGHRVPFLPKALKRRELFDADKVGSPIMLRHWRPGDRFQPIGMAEQVKLQDLFVNQKIARERRHKLVVAEAAAGDLFWVEGLRISERFKLSEQTNRCLQWQWNPL
jgi:tRNA(Ile)-lysidine synthase